MGLLAELKRRNVIRMAGLYLVGAWLIVQVAGTLLPMFEAPAWVARTIVVILALGFVPTMIFSWVYELTPEGLKRDADVPQIVRTLRPRRGFTHLLHRGHQQRDQDRDDRDHDQ